MRFRQLKNKLKFGDEIEMVENVVLKGKVEIDKFDGSNKESYIVSFKGYNWIVSEFIADVIMILKRNKCTSDELIIQLSNKYDSTKIDGALQRTMDFLKQNGLIEGYQEKEGKKSSLWFRFTLIPEKIVNRLSFFCFLFYEPLLLVLTIGSFIWLIYVLMFESIQSLSQQLIKFTLPELFLCYGIMLLIGLLHELGHASALMFSGEKAGRIGCAFYILSPVLFSNVTNTWRLNRKERFIVDYGGIYFQILFSELLYFINLFWINSYILEIVSLIEAVSVFSNFNPFLKFDGYWMLNDILGTSNLFFTVKKYWKDFFDCSKTKKNIWDKKTSIIIIIYTICSIGFVIYFLFLTFSTLSNAFKVIYLDIQSFLSMRNDITLSIVLKYIIERFSILLLVASFIILTLKILINLVKTISKKFKEWYH